MGFLRKITGAQGQIDSMNRNADIQVAATEQAAAAQTKALNDAAMAAAQAQKQAAARARVEEQAADAASKPLAVADVALDAEQQGSAIGESRRRRASFGRSYGSGVSI
jgi:hypothetical protein